MNPEQKLHTDVIPYWRVKRVVTCFIWIAGFSLPIILYFFWLSTWHWLFYASLSLIGFVLAKDVYFIIHGVKIKYSRYGYTMGEDEIQIRWGDFWSESSSIIPMNRIQHVDKEQSVLAKKYNLAELEFYTAGEAHFIPGLKMDVADEIRAQVIKLAKIGDTDAYND
ncbi:PH domain-containing protein [Brevibacillus sp. NPDC058079]|uniref:PH domain-containing protein n=1 Tax=Brevibacillus sp. NPDC058079 TaxID=3346330 RepID=UPI0036E09655